VLFLIEERAIMTTPTYIAKRIGNDYKIIRTDTEGVVLSSMTALGGGLLMLNGLRSGLINKMLGIAGAGIAYYGLTGKNPITAIQELWGTIQGEQSEEHGPSFQHDEHTQNKQLPEDEVDEASMESFPASDAPARSRSTASA
jgi:hypothetical protein